MYKNSATTSQGTHYVSTTAAKLLILFTEIIIICCENHTKQTNTLGWHNAEFIYVKAGDLKG
jgi:hypothetical protein